MATIRLIPSTYYLSSTSYLSVASADNMYTNTDSDTYATVTNSRTSTTSYYIYLRGFDFDSIPSSAVVSSFTVRLKARESGVSTSSSYQPYLANDTTAINGSCSAISTTATVHEFSGISADWETIKGYGDDFGIRINCRRASRNTTSYMYIYGAEIEVEYTLPTPRTVTTTLSGNGTILPSGATTTYDDEEFELTITPSDIGDVVTVSNNGTDVTAELVEHYSGGSSASASQVAGNGVTTGFNRSGSAFYQSSSTTSDSWLRYAIGHTAENPYSTSNTSNTYVKDGTNDASTMGWMNYPFDFSALPDDAEVTSIEVKCYGAAESTSQTARHADVALYCGDELKSTSQTFSSTSNSTMTISDPGEWDREELQDAWLRFTVGYYGGRLLGITWKVNYTTGGTLDHYTYTYIVNGDATIAVVIGGSGETDRLYVKLNGSWIEVSKAYRKVNNSWTEIDITTAFSNNVNYIQGN